MAELGQTLAQLRKMHGYTQQGVAAHLTKSGMPATNQAVSKWECGLAQPSIPQFLLLCQLYGVQDVLATFMPQACPPRLNQQGATLLRSIEQALHHSGLYTPAAPKPTLRFLPLYDIPASAGTGQFLSDSGCEQVQVDAAVPQQANFGVRIAGDSMEPLFTHGQPVWVHRQRTLAHGEIGIFALNENAYIKKLHSQNGAVQLVSLNPQYAPIPVTDADALVVFGKVLC